MLLPGGIMKRKKGLLNCDNNTPASHPRAKELVQALEPGWGERASAGSHQLEQFLVLPLRRPMNSHRITNNDRSGSYL